MEDGAGSSGRTALRLIELCERFAAATPGLIRFKGGPRKQNGGPAERVVLGMTSSDPFEIVGVVGDVRHRELSETPSPNAYVTYAQQPRSFGLTFVIRSSSPSTVVLSSVRNAIRTLDSSLPLFDVQPLVPSSRGRRRNKDSRPGF